MSASNYFFKLPNNVNEKLAKYNGKDYIFTSYEGVLSYYQSNGDPTLTNSCIGYSSTEGRPGQEYVFDLNDDFIFTVPTISTLISEDLDSFKKTTLNADLIILLVSKTNRKFSINAGDIVNITLYPSTTANNMPFLFLSF